MVTDKLWMAQRRRMGRRAFLSGALAASGAAVALTSACGSRSATPAQQGSQATATAASKPQSGGTFAAPSAGNAPSLDPHKTSSFYMLDPAGAVYSRLLQFQASSDVKTAESHEIRPDLAVSAESPDAQTWTVKLRPNATFQNVAPVNGHAVQAEDIKASFTRAFMPSNPGRDALSMIDPNQIETPSTDTVVFKLQYPFGLFQQTLAAPADSYILPREAQAGSYDPAQEMIGSGPFELDNYTPDVAFRFSRNKDWYGAPLPHVDALRWAITADPSAWRAQFTAGHLDVLQGPGISISSFNLPALKQSNPRATVIRGDPGGAQILFFKLDDPASPFRDVRLRQAVSLAIDRRAIAKAVYNDDAEPQFYVFLSLGKWAMRMNDLPADTDQYYQYNPTKAKQLLQASGIGNQLIKLLYIHPYLGPAYEKAAQTIANMLSAAGMNAEAVQIDYQKDYVGGGKGVRFGNYDKDSMVFAGTGDFTNVDQSLSAIYSSKATVHLSRPGDPEIDTMLTKARALRSESEQVTAYMDLQKYLAGKIYTVAGLPQPYTYVLVGPRVQNYQYANDNAIATESFAGAWLKQ